MKGHADSKTYVNHALSPLVKLCWSRGHLLYRKAHLFMILILWLLWAGRAVWSQLKMKIAWLQEIPHFSRVWTNQSSTARIMSLKTIVLSAHEPWYCDIRTEVPLLTHIQFCLILTQIKQLSLLDSHHVYSIYFAVATVCHCSIYIESL